MLCNLFVNQVTIFCTKMLPSIACDSLYLQSNWNPTMAAFVCIVLFLLLSPILGTSGYPCSLWICQGREGMNSLCLLSPSCSLPHMVIFSSLHFPLDGPSQECRLPDPTHLTLDLPKPCHSSCGL